MKIAKNWFQEERLVVGLPFHFDRQLLATRTVIQKLCMQFTTDLET